MPPTYLQCMLKEFQGKFQRDIRERERGRVRAREGEGEGEARRQHLLKILNNVEPLLVDA